MCVYEREGLFKSFRRKIRETLSKQRITQGRLYGGKKMEKIYNNEGVSEAADGNPLYLMFSRGLEEI